MQAYAVALQLSPRSGAGSPLSLAGTPHLYGRPPPYVRALLAAFARGTLKGFPAAAPEMRAFSMASMAAAASAAAIASSSSST